MNTKSDNAENPPGNARRLPGTLPSKEWHSRGYLPHRDKPGLLQMITYHLADSLPAELVEKFKMEIQCLQQKKQNTQYRKKIENWIDAGCGSCILKNPQIAQLVYDNFTFYNGKRYDLISWVIMPNHIHVLIYAYEGVALSKIIQSWKGYTGKKINEILKISGRVWHREYWDRYIRDEKHYNSTIKYIEQNPVKAGLVEKAEDWKWSSSN